MTQKYPYLIFLFSGKRKSGKDFVTEKLNERLQNFKPIIVRLSGPIKQEYAETHDLSVNELLSSSVYKESYRKDMIEWSEKKRAEDSGCFIRSALKMYEAETYPVWIVSDMRRHSDLKWFSEAFKESTTLCSVRISASEKTRMERGFVFSIGIDDAESECDLDDYNKWQFEFQNDSSDSKEVEKFLDKLEEYCIQICSAKK